MKIINNRFNKSKITGENTFNGDHFEIEDNHESNKDEKSLFWAFCRFVTHALIFTDSAVVFSF